MQRCTARRSASGGLYRSGRAPSGWRRSIRIDLTLLLPARLRGGNDVIARQARGRPFLSFLCTGFGPIPAILLGVTKACHTLRFPNNRALKRDGLRYFSNAVSFRFSWFATQCWSWAGASCAAPNWFSQLCWPLKDVTEGPTTGMTLCNSAGGGRGWFGCMLRLRGAAAALGLLKTRFGLGNVGGGK